MTVAIGLVCPEGVVVASDSMASQGGLAIREQKVHALQNVPLVWTSSGAVYVIEEVQQALEGMDKKAAGPSGPLHKNFHAPHLADIRTELANTVRNTMRKCYESIMPGHQMLVDQRGGGQMHPFASDFLLLGYANKTPYFLEVAHDGQLNWHHDSGFYAVGSGGEYASVAQALMAHHLDGPDLTLELTIQVAYRAIANTINVSSQFVGFPVRLAVADAAGARVLGDEDVEEVEAAVQAWMKFEADGLRRPLNPENVPPEQPPSYSEDEATGDL